MTRPHRHPTSPVSALRSKATADGRSSARPHLEPSMSENLPPHLRRLEAESIHIMREVVSEFRAPVMLYSIGKDSGAMLQLHDHLQ